MFKSILYNVTLVTSLFLFTSMCFASDFDNYLQAIENGSNEERVVARQMLKREGIRAVPPLIELLQHEDQLVWRNARNILADIVNMVAAAPIDEDMAKVIENYTKSRNVKNHHRRSFEALPQEVKERVEVTDSLMALVLDENTPSHAVIEGLRLLGVIAPADYGLVGLIDLLEKPEYSGEVYSAVKMIGTSTELPLSMLVYYSFVTRRIELVEDYILKGGNWDTGINLYLDGLLLSNAQHHAPSIVGLARFGDATVIPAIMDAVKKNPELEAPALMGLNDMQGLESYEALLAAYPETSQEMQLGLLGVFGRAQHELFLPLLLENVGSDDVGRQTAAFNALVQSDLPGGVDAIVQYVANRPEDDRKFEVMDLLAYADRLHDKGAKAAAGKAYLGLYRSASHPDDKDIAFQGIKRYPSPEAYDLILADLDLEKLDEVSSETLIALNVMINKESNPEAYAKIREALYGIIKETSNVQSVLNMAAKQGASDQFLSMLGFVQDWYLIGPFPWSSAEGFTANPVGAPVVDLKASFSVDGEPRTWKKVRTGQIVNLMGLMGAESNVSSYAYATVMSPAEMDAQVRVGSDDGVQVWLNGESVHENNVDRGMALDQDIVNVKLKKGENKLLLQVSQGGGGWGFMCRLTQPDSSPLSSNN